MGQTFRKSLLLLLALVTLTSVFVFTSPLAVRGQCGGVQLNMAAGSGSTCDTYYQVYTYSSTDVFDPAHGTHSQQIYFQMLDGYPVLCADLFIDSQSGWSVITYGQTPVNYISWDCSNSATVFLAASFPNFVYGSQPGVRQYLWASATSFTVSIWFKPLGGPNPTATLTPSLTSTASPTFTPQAVDLLGTPISQIFCAAMAPTSTLTAAPSNTPGVIPTSDLGHGIMSRPIGITALAPSSTPNGSMTPTPTFVTLTPTITPTCTVIDTFTPGGPAVTLPNLSTGSETCYTLVPSVNLNFGPLVIPIINVTLVPAINVNYPGAQVCISTFELSFSVFGIDFSIWITAFLTMAGIGMAWGLLQSTL